MPYMDPKNFVPLVVDRANASLIGGLVFFLCKTREYDEKGEGGGKKRVSWLKVESGTPKEVVRKMVPRIVKGNSKGVK